MKVKYFIKVIALLLPIISFGQIDIDRTERLYMDKFNLYQGTNEAVKGLINVSGNLEINSNTITNSFLRSALYEGEIKDETKFNTFDALKKTNRFGLVFNTGVTGTYRKGNTIILAGLHHNEFFASKFTDDFFKLVFHGNKQFEDKTANLNSIHINYFNYQNFFIGLLKEYKEGKLIAGGGISIVRGGNYQKIQLNRGSLYTAPGGEYIDLDMDFNLAFSDKDNRIIPKAKGLGLGANLNLTYKLEKVRFNFEMKDLGFISWNNLNYFQGDSLYRYEGVKVNNIFSLNDSTFTDINPDTIASQYGLNKQKKNKSIMLPATFNFNTVYNVNEKFDLVFGAKYILSNAYMPKIYIKPVYYLNKRFIIIPAISYGGFGGFDIELGAVKSFGDKFLLSANLFYLEYFLLPKKSSGHGFNVSLTKVF